MTKPKDSYDYLREMRGIQEKLVDMGKVFSKFKSDFPDESDSISEICDFLETRQEDLGNLQSDFQELIRVSSKIVESLDSQYRSEVV